MVNEAVHHRLTVPPDVHSPRLDKFIAEALPSLSRARVQKLLEDGHVSVDGKPVKPSARLKAGQNIVVTEPPAVVTELVAQDLPLQVVFEDDAMIVINKAAGVVVHPGAGTPDGTIVNALMHHVPGLPPIGGELRPGIVHRLDKDTSGILVVAKGDQALRALQSEFKERRAEKRYLALCLGAPSPSKGTYETPFGRHPTQRVKFTSRKGPRNAITDYRVLGTHDGVSAVELTLHTGRTHQIRVHLSEHGHPILGDALYGGKKASELAGRQMLHATLLALRHPTTEKPMRFVAPLPSDVLETASRYSLRDVVTAWFQKM